MSRISEVADRAGVSAMTVSRVLNNSGYVRAATRQRVELAIAELGYVPNALARQLRSKRTKMLALVLSDISNPFFTTIARGVEDAASVRGFAVMFCNTDESDEEELRYLRLLVERQVDGVLLVPAQNAAASLRLLRTHSIPVVVLDRRASRRVDNVRCDSEAGAHALARHLVALGHRRIAVLTGRRSISTSADRVAGVRRALAEAGLALDESLVRYGGFNFGSKNLADGRLMAQEVLAATDDPPTAVIFAANNFIAFGAVRALRDLGLKVPDDISVVAFDDLPVEWVDEPFLTVAAQPAYDIGRRAAELMIDRLEGERTTTGESVVLPFELTRPAVDGGPSGAPDVASDETAARRCRDASRRRRAVAALRPGSMTPGAVRSAPATYLLGTRRGLEACASPRGTFAVLALDHRQNLRKELSTGRPPIGDLRRDGGVQARGGPGACAVCDGMPPRPGDRRRAVHRGRLAARPGGPRRCDRGHRIRGAADGAGQPGAPRLVGRAGQEAGCLGGQAARLLPPRGDERRSPGAARGRGGGGLPGRRPAAVRRAPGVRSGVRRQADRRRAQERRHRDRTPPHGAGRGHPQGRVPVRPCCRRSRRVGGGMRGAGRRQSPAMGPPGQRGWTTSRSSGRPPSHAVQARPECWSAGPSGHRPRPWLPRSAMPG